RLLRRGRRARPLPVPGRAGKAVGRTSGKGLLVRVAPDGSARTIYDSEKSEISSLTAGPDGEVWAAAVSTRGGGGPGPAPHPPAAPPPNEKKSEPRAPPGGGEGGASVTVTATTSFAPPTASPSNPKAGESSELV